MKNKIIALIVATLVGICLAAYFAMKPMDTKLANDNKNEAKSQITSQRAEEIINETGDIVGDVASPQVIIMSDSPATKGLVSYAKIPKDDTKVIISRLDSISKDRYEPEDMTPQIEAFETIVYDYQGDKKLEVGKLRPKYLDGMPLIKGQGFDYYIYAFEKNGKKYIIEYELYNDPKGGENGRETVYEVSDKKLNKVLVVEKATDSTYRGKEELYYIDKNESDKGSVDAALKKLGLEGTFDIDWVEGKNKPKIDASQISALNCHMGKLTIGRNIDDQVKDMVKKGQLSGESKSKNKDKVDSKNKSDDKNKSSQTKASNAGDIIKLDDNISVKIPPDAKKYSRVEMFEDNNGKSVRFYSKEHDAKIPRDGNICSIWMSDEDYTGHDAIIVLGSVKTSKGTKYITASFPQDLPVQDQSAESGEIFFKNYTAIKNIIKNNDMIVPAKGVEYKKK